METGKKKVLILSLSCDIEQYIEEENVIKETWGKRIFNGEKDNFDILFMHSSKNDYIDHDNHVIFIKSKDGYYDTGEKTLKSLILLNEQNVDYDYILFTNTATVINIDLVDLFVNSEFINNDKIYGGKLIFPVSHVPFFRGDFILVHKSLVDEIIKSDNDFMERKYPNDEVITLCLIKYRKSLGLEVINQFIELNSIDYIEDFNFNDANQYFYVSTKIMDIERSDNDVMICAMKLIWYYVDRLKVAVDFNKIVRKPTVIELNNGVYKIELIKH